jgi:hypothetical protein
MEQIMKTTLSGWPAILATIALGVGCASASAQAPGPGQPGYNGGYTGGQGYSNGAYTGGQGYYSGGYSGGQGYYSPAPSLTQPKSYLSAPRVSAMPQSTYVPLEPIPHKSKPKPKPKSKSKSGDTVPGGR